MIEVKDLYYKYNSYDIALRGISFSVADHEWVSIVGHNGSGKSTLAKLLDGLIWPTNGEIYYDGEKLSQDNVSKLRQRIGIVFQNPDNQFVGYNVKYDIAFGLENHQVAREDMIILIDEWTKKVDMHDYLSREPESLSGGQKQRVAIAGILALNCDIIILDEATSMLDPKGTKEIEDLIIELKEKYNKTIITITHDLGLAMKSDRVILLNEGKIVLDDKPEEVFKNRELLLESNLDMPFSLKATYLASKSDKLNSNKELMDVLWEYHLKK